MFASQMEAILASANSGSKAYNHNAADTQVDYALTRFNSDLTKDTSYVQSATRPGAKTNTYDGSVSIDSQDRPIYVRWVSAGCLTRFSTAKLDAFEYPGL